MESLETVSDWTLPYLKFCVLFRGLHLSLGSISWDIRNCFSNLKLRKVYSSTLSLTDSQEVERKKRTTHLSNFDLMQRVGGKPIHTSKLTTNQLPNTHFQNTRRRSEAGILEGYDRKSKRKRGRLVDLQFLISLDF